MKEYVLYEGLALYVGRDEYYDKTSYTPMTFLCGHVYRIRITTKVYLSYVYILDEQGKVLNWVPYHFHNFRHYWRPIEAEPSQPCPTFGQEVMNTLLLGSALQPRTALGCGQTVALPQPYDEIIGPLARTHLSYILR